MASQWIAIKIKLPEHPRSSTGGVVGTRMAPMAPGSAGHPPSPKRLLPSLGALSSHQALRLITLFTPATECTSCGQATNSATMVRSYLGAILVWRSMSLYASRFVRCIPDTGRGRGMWHWAQLIHIRSVLRRTHSGMLGWW